MAERIIDSAATRILSTFIQPRNLDEIHANFHAQAPRIETRKLATFVARQDDYFTIAAALDAASAADTINLWPNYSDEVAIVKNDIAIFESSSSQGIALQIGNGVSGLVLSDEAPVKIRDSGGDSTVSTRDGDNVITVTGGNDVIDGGVGDVVDGGESPEQITGHLKDMGGPSVSPEWIYPMPGRRFYRREGAYLCR